MSSEKNQTLIKETVLPAEKGSFLSRIPEDIWAVWIGGLLTTAILVIAFLSPGFRFTTPLYQWASGNDLLTKVIATSNILLLAIIGLVFFLLSSVAVAASGSSVKNYAAGFSIIYIIAIISLIIAGNKAISYYGIEYVVFALLIGLLLSNLFSNTLLVERCGTFRILY